MKVATLRSFMALHSWVGIATGLLLFIAFYAGALTVCHESLDGWERTGPPSPTAVEPARAQALVDAFRAAHPATNADFRLTLSGEGNGQPRIDWRGAGSVPHAVELRPGGALDDIADTVGFAEMVHRLHYSAGIPLPWGAYLFGLVCVLYGLALVSGVVVHLPVLRRDLFALRPGHNRKRFWQDAHNLGGLFALPFHIVFAWTGAVLTIGTLMLAPFQVFVFEGRLLNLIGAEVGLAPPVAAAGVAAPMVDRGPRPGDRRAPSAGADAGRPPLRERGRCAGADHRRGRRRPPAHEPPRVRDDRCRARRRATGRRTVAVVHRPDLPPHPLRAALRRLRRRGGALALRAARADRRRRVLHRQPALDRGPAGATGRRSSAPSASAWRS